MRNRFLKKAIAILFLIIHMTELFASNLIVDPNANHNTKLDKSNTGVPIVNVSTPNHRG
ncbi:filamentous hemagglutinin, partial [Fusobacterium necrophorum]